MCVTPTNLSSATEENLHALFRAMAETLEGAEIMETNAVSRHHVFPSNSMHRKLGFEDTGRTIRDICGSPPKVRPGREQGVAK